MILNLFGLEETLSWVSWFIYLYIWAMTVMPFMSRLIDKRPIICSLACAIISWGLMVVIHQFIPDFFNQLEWKTLFSCLSWTPTIILGYLFAKKQLFQKMRIKNHKAIPYVAIMLILGVLYAKNIFTGFLIFNADILYATVIIGCILIIFSQYELKWASRLFQEFGDKSVYMWFVHALFLTAATRHVYQQFIIVSDNLWIIAIWTILLSYIISLIIKKIVEI